MKPYIHYSAYRKTNANTHQKLAAVIVVILVAILYMTVSTLEYRNELIKQSHSQENLVIVSDE